MFHRERVWQIMDVAPEALAETLQRVTWCCCQGFRAGGMLWLNDATSPDGAEEYAVVLEDGGRQFESITVSWIDPDRLRNLVAQFAQEIAMGKQIPVIGDWALRPASLAHGEEPCRHCA